MYWGNYSIENGKGFYWTKRCVVIETKAIIGNVQYSLYNFLAYS